MEVLVAAWIGSTNLGDELIFSIVSRRVQEAGAQATALSISPNETTTIHGVPATYARRPIAVVRALRGADRMVFGGGGILQNETSPWNLPFHLSRIAGARALRVPYAGYALGATGLSGRTAPVMIRAALRGHRALTVRDKGSLETLRGMGLENAVLAADPVVSLKPPETQPVDRIVVSLRPSNVPGSILPVAWRRGGPIAPVRWLAAMASTLDRAASTTGLAIHFVAMQQGRDDVLHEAVADRMHEAATTSTPTIGKVAGEIAASRAVVAMRYHAGILGAVGLRPSVLIGYSPKVADLAAELGAGSAIVDNDPDSLNRIPTALEAVMSRHEEVAEGLNRLRSRETLNQTALERLLEPQ